MLKNILRNPPTTDLGGSVKEESIQQLQERAMKLSNQINNNFANVQSCLGQLESSQMPLMSDSEKQALANQQQELEKLKGELESLSHEKVVLDVLTRPLVQNIHLQQQLRNMKSGPKIPFVNSIGSQRSPVNSNSSTSDKTIPIPEYIPLHHRQSKLLNKHSNANSNSPIPLVRNTKGGVVVPNIKLANEFPEELQFIRSKPVINHAVPTKKLVKIRRK